MKYAHFLKKSLMFRFHPNISPGSFEKRGSCAKNEDVFIIYRNDAKIGEVIKTSEGYVVLFEGGVEPLCKPGLYEELPPFLDNLLPEGANREILIKKHGIDPGDKFALLAYC